MIVSGWLYYFRLFCLAICYALLAIIAINSFSNKDIVSIIWPCSGLALGALLLGGFKYWPGVLLGAFLGEYLSGVNLPVSIAIAFGNLLEALAGYCLLKSNKRFNTALIVPYDYLLLVLSAVLSAVISALIGVSALRIFTLPNAAWSLEQLLNWWQGDVLGILLITPMMLVWRKPPVNWFKRDRLVETCACFGGAWLLGQVIFLDWFQAIIGTVPGFWLFLFLVWSAVRYGRHGSLLVLLVSTLQGLQGLLSDVGYFGHLTRPNDLITCWSYTLVMSTIGVVLALILHNKDQMVEKLRQSEEKLRAMFEMSPLGMARNTMQGYFVEANPTLLSMLGYTLTELQQLNYWELTPKEYDLQEIQQLELLETQNRYGPYEKAFIHKQGFLIDVRLNGVLITGKDGEKYMWSIIENISERKKNEEAMRIAALVYQNSSEAMLVFDVNNVILAVNPAYTELTGYSEDEVVGKTLALRHSVFQDRQFYDDMKRTLERSGKWQGEIWNRHKSGDVRTEHLTINTIFNLDGSVHRRVALFHDITEHKKAENLIWQQANFDTLTTLPNRNLFHQRLTSEIQKVQTQQSRFALLFIDLDRFKEINDSFGHGVGDQLLTDAALRIQSCVRNMDTVARLGGDEFTIILSNLENFSEVETISSRIINELSNPFKLNQELVYISASIGIVYCPEHSQDAEELLKFADQAMYSAKKQGRKRYCLYNQTTQQHTQKRMRLANDLHNALAHQQLSVVYQPIINLQTGLINKAEILLRWQHPVFGAVSPAEFIPLAEETGLIVDIGEWVFQQTVSQVLIWRQRYQPEFQISINKSPIQFYDADKRFDSWPAQLEANVLSGTSIVVEITEGMLLDNNPLIIQQFNSLRDHNIQVALDDFGTGYSSLAYLKKFDIDYLKIDQSFVRNLDSQSEDGVLCEAIIVMAHKLGIKVIAEGVETLEQFRLLKDMGCDFGQGYFFSKPVNSDVFSSYLNDNLSF